MTAADVQHEELLTERQSLRRPMPEDIDAILAIHRDSRTCTHNPSDALASRDEAEALFARWDEHWKHHGFGYWVVRYGGATGPVGFCGLKVMQFRERAILNLFYRFDPAVWGQGFATEAATAVVAWAGKHQPHVQSSPACVPPTRYPHGSLLASASPEPKTLTAEDTTVTT